MINFVTVAFMLFLVVLERFECKHEHGVGDGTHMNSFVIAGFVTLRL